MFREAKRFASLVVSRWNHYWRRINDFAGLFVFNHLTAVSFRAVREAPPPKLRSPHPGPFPGGRGSVWRRPPHQAGLAATFSPREQGNGTRISLDIKVTGLTIRHHTINFPKKRRIFLKFRFIWNRVPSADDQTRESECQREPLSGLTDLRFQPLRLKAARPGSRLRRSRDWFRSYSSRRGWQERRCRGRSPPL